jgi:hypothetical protein
VLTPSHSRHPRPCPAGMHSSRCQEAHTHALTWALECAGHSDHPTAAGKLEVCYLYTLRAARVGSTCPGGLETVAGLRLI